MRQQVERSITGRQGWWGSSDFWVLAGLSWLFSAYDLRFLQHRGWLTPILNVLAAIFFFWEAHRRNPIARRLARWLFWPIGLAILGTLLAMSILHIP